MGRLKRVGDLDIRYDPAHEEREWVVQRIGWALMALAALAALAGVLGPGPLSRTQGGKIGNPLYVEYQRFSRYQAPAELKIYCRPEGKDEFELGFDRKFIEGTEIAEISPEPEETKTRGDQYLYRFKGGAGENHLVTFRTEAASFGKAQSKVTLDGKHSVNIRLFYWP